MICLITGSGGLIGSTCVKYFSPGFDTIVGIDNNMRQYFFGQDGDVTPTINRLRSEVKNYVHYDFDIRDAYIDSIFKKHKFDLIIHTAAQPSHDWACREPILDFDINARGTLLLLEAMRNHCPEAVFVFTSTNKVYGSTPNTLNYGEGDTRWELPEWHPYYNGIDETMSIDNTVHSLFGVSKLAADVMVQEYGKYFGLKTVVFRGGCLTGVDHSAAELHGFLAYLVKCIVNDREYTIYGHKGKQVRDNINAYDVCTAIDMFYREPIPGEVYNLGGTRFANISVLEAIAKIELLSGHTTKIKYDSRARVGDHIWWITDMSKFKHDYPLWQHTYDIDRTLAEMVEVAGRYHLGGLGNPSL